MATHTEHKAKGRIGSLSPAESTAPMTLNVAPSYHVQSGSEELMRLLPGHRRGSRSESSHVSLLFERGAAAIESALASVYRGCPEEVPSVVLREIGPARVSLMPMRDIDGSVAGALLIVYPGDAPGAESPLPLSAGEQYRILDATGELFAYLEPDMSIRWANRAAAASVGLHLKDIAGRRCHEVWHGRTSPCEHCPVVKAARTLTPQEAEVRTPDGRQFIIRSYPVTDGDGALTGLVEFGRDVTQQRATQEALRQAANLLESIMDNSPYPISVLDREGNYVMVNQATSRLYGLPRESLEGHHLTEFLPEETGSLFHRRIQRLIKEQRPVTVEDRVAKDGQVGVFYTTLFPIWSDNGEISAIGGITADVTELKDSQEKAERADAQKARLLQEIHVRVRNNLQMISSLINLNCRPELSAPTKEVLEETQGRLRAMSLAHEGTHEAQEFGAVDLASYAQSLVAEIIQSHDCAETVSLSFWSDPVVVPLEFAISFGLLLNELVCNACKHAFASDRAGLLEIAISDNRRSIVLRVSDNGPGLQEPNVDSRLGLAIVRGLVDHLRGGIELDVSDGTAWKVTLALAPEDRLSGRARE